MAGPFYGESDKAVSDGVISRPSNFFIEVESLATAVLVAGWAGNIRPIRSLG